MLRGDKHVWTALEELTVLECHSIERLLKSRFDLHTDARTDPARVEINTVS